MSRETGARSNLKKINVMRKKIVSSTEDSFSRFRSERNKKTVNISREQPKERRSISTQQRKQ